MIKKDFQEYIYRALKVEAAKNSRFWIDKTVYVFGNVWIVYDHFSGGLTGFEKMSPLRVKGKALPVEIWSYKHKPSR